MVLSELVPGTSFTMSGDYKYVLLKKSPVAKDEFEYIYVSQSGELCGMNQFWAERTKVHLCYHPDLFTYTI